ncbi:AMP-dependent ligase [Desulfosarcina alkanivorans]|uniref:AMP-dependent ligase n=1 Tax=Desulfosarcina alkanivorans TaxID=571177 RepID=A0A5K7YKF6_9BACT|nr:AMP-binding protein [Desulfosarcina alkanivorans]BBO67291.1 AMP-dependent ligase [Desulfosarcina alkanivorans]
MLVHNFLENSAIHFRNKIALVSGEQRITYHDLDDVSNNLARFLIDIGIKRQERIIICLENSIEAVISIFGVLKAGAVFVIVNPNIKAPKLSHILNDSGATALIAGNKKREDLSKVTTKERSKLNLLWVNDFAQDESEQELNIVSHQWIDAVTCRSNCALPRTIDVDLATIIYTSGSTGEPKGVVSAHYNIVNVSRSISSVLGNTKNDVILNMLPLSFDYGLYQIIMAASFGGTVVLEKSFTFPYSVLKKIEQEKVTGIPIVPTIAALLLQFDLSKLKLGSLRYITNTADALPIAHTKKLQSVLPHVKIYSMYGLTECKRVSYLPPEYLTSKPTSVGIPIPNEEVFVVDEDGHEVETGKVGELVVRGINVMQGYWNCPEETARTFRPGRYRGETLLYSGDLFKRDEDGFLYFIGRKEYMIKSKGERISPKEIENIICSLENVIEAAVIGVADNLLGQAIKAFIVSKNNSLNKEDVLRYCKEKLEPVLLPKYIEFVSFLPKSSSGKIDKKRLKN